jgi:Pyridoxamine 5'-phosphate oxidase
MRRLGAKSITALVVADREVAWQILALNTEKAHNLKERSLEVIRIYRGLVDEDATRPESTFAFYLDEPALVTLGVCYERFPRFGGGAYHPILRRLETFTDEPLRSAIKDHEKRATMVLDLEERVGVAAKKLKERGLVSPYLRSFVVARINPLRWIKGEPPPLEEVLKTMRERAAKFNVEKIKPQDLAGAAGPPDEETSESRPRMTTSSGRKHAGPGPVSDQPSVPEPTFAERARTLVYLSRMGSLSTLSRKQPGFPFGSVMPYGLDDHGRPIFLISSMAMHTQNLQADARASLLVTQEDTDGEPLGASRVTLVGNVLPVPKTELVEARKLYLERHASSKYWVDFEDFSFYRMDIIDVYYVGGFGVMGWVSASDYDRSQPDPLAESMAGII